MTTYHVTTASGADVTVTGDRTELDEARMTITVYSGDDVVGSFRSYSSFWADAEA